MTAIELLERCRSAGSDIRNIRSDITRYRDALTNVSQRLDAVGGSSGSGGPMDRPAEILAEISRLEQLLADRQRQYDAEILVSCKILDVLAPASKMLLHQYYVNGLGLADIARAMRYSYGHVRNVKAEALRDIARHPFDIPQLLPPWYLEKDVTVT